MKQNEIQKFHKKTHIQQTNKTQKTKSLAVSHVTPRAHKAEHGDTIKTMHKHKQKNKLRICVALDSFFCRSFSDSAKCITDRKGEKRAHQVVECKRRQFVRTRTECTNSGGESNSANHSSLAILLLIDAAAAHSHKSKRAATNSGSQPNDDGQRRVVCVQRSGHVVSLVALTHVRAAAACVSHRHSPPGPLHGSFVHVAADGRAQLFDTASGAPVAAVQHPNHMKHSPLTVALAGDAQVRCAAAANALRLCILLACHVEKKCCRWRLARTPSPTHTHTHTHTQTCRRGARVRIAAYSPTHSRRLLRTTQPLLALGTASGTVLVFAHGELAHSLATRGGAVHAAVFGEFPSIATQ